MVMNNPERVESQIAMVECLRRNLRLMSVSKHELESLSGELQFALQFVTGPLWEDDIQLLDFIAEWLRSSVPRLVSCEAGKPLRAYTDGACEDEGRQVSCGGLLVDPEGGNEVFGFDIPVWLLTTWGGGPCTRGNLSSGDIAKSCGQVVME
eukprot:1900432-Amphidinium_carterae.2